MSDPSKELAQQLDALLHKRYGSNSPTMQRQMFDYYDKDRDGRISAAELTHLLEDARVGNALTRGRWVSGVLDKMDTSRDAGISWEEYEAALQEARQRP